MTELLVGIREWRARGHVRGVVIGEDRDIALEVSNFDCLICKRFASEFGNTCCHAPYLLICAL